MKNQKIIVTLLTFVSLWASCQQYVEVDAPKELQGLWFDKETMYWVLKIEPNTIFWENQIESIIKIERYQDQYRITTSTRNINLELSSEVLLLNGNELTRAFREEDRIAEHTEQNNQRGQAVIQGFIGRREASSQGSPLKIFVNDYILGEQLVYLSEIDSNGFFKIEFELNGTQDIILRDVYFDRRRKLLVSPGDTLTINLPGSDQVEGAHFAGNNAAANYDIFYMNELYAKHIPDYRAVNRALGLEPNEYLAFRRVYWQSEQAFLEAYCKERNCTDLFKEWFKAHAEVNYFSSLMKFSWQSLSYGFGSEKRLTGEIKENYERAFMDSINQDSKLYQLSSGYFGLLNGISHRLIQRTDEKRRMSKRKEITFLLEDEVLLSKSERIFLEKYKDSGIDIKVLSESEKEQWWAIEDKLAEKLQNFRMKSGFEFFINDFLQASNKNTKDLLISQVFYRSILLNRNYEIMDWAFNKLSTHIENEAYHEYLTSLYEEVKEQEVQIDNLDLAAMRFDGTGEKLLQKIRKDYPNQLIMLDFWGTWCQPCLKDFEVTKKVKDALTKVKFVYLCINSSEKNWKNILIKYKPKGDHYLLTQRQTDELLKHFNIRAFPTYFLIDLEGKVHKKIPKPTNIKEFKQYIKKVG